MLEISQEQLFYAFSDHMTPAAYAQDGEVVRFHTVDCYLNTLKEGMVWDDVRGIAPENNPTTGPVFVRGAHPGDTLKVEILSIQTAKEGVMHVSNRSGGLKKAVAYEQTRRFAVDEDGNIEFDGIKVPSRPMIGVIGVATGEGEIDTETPHDHGGNMDDRDIVEGCTLYFPVRQEGALFGLGDVHAQMGDGEVCVCGLEIPAAVEVRLSVIPGRQERFPVWEKDGRWAVICSARTLDEAAELARYAMLDFLTKRVDMPVNSLCMLLSLIGDTAVCQVVDPLLTVRFTLRQEAFPIQF